eukprot:4321955-Ditylum_brightwellii.AAC.1
MIYIPTTKQDCIADTVEFFNHKFTLPTLGGKYVATKAALDLIQTLNNPNPTSPLLQIGNDQHSALKRPAQIFHEAWTQHKQTQQVSIQQPTAPIPPQPPVNMHPQTVQNHSQPRVPSHPPSYHNSPLQNIGAPVTQFHTPRVTQEHDSSTKSTTTTNAINFHPNSQSMEGSAPECTTTKHSNCTQMQSSVHKETHSPSTICSCSILHCTTTIFVNAIIDKETGWAMEYRHLIKLNHKDLWHCSYANEFGCLAQGIGTCKKGTNTICFMARDQNPEGRKLMYTQFAVEHRPQKTEKHCTRLTVGRN